MCHAYGNKSLFTLVSVNKELRYSDLVLKQTFQLLDEPPLCYKAVPARRLQSVSLFSPSNDFTCWLPPCMPQIHCMFNMQIYTILSRASAHANKYTARITDLFCYLENAVLLANKGGNLVKHFL